MVTSPGNLTSNLQSAQAQVRLATPAKVQEIQELSESVGDTVETLALDFETANAMLDSLDWTNLLDSESWSTWKLLCTPQGILSDIEHLNKGLCEPETLPIQRQSEGEILITGKI